MPQPILNRISVVVIALSILTGAALRAMRLGSVPLGLHPDEAVVGYDAYSILKTGRDHRGNFLPLAMESFRDYRMPLYQYSLVPLVAAFGLKTSTVRLEAALWGIVDLLAITALAGLMFGLPGAAAASLLYALSPWHLELSRYGQEMTIASATITMAVLSFFFWLRNHRDRWLIASAILFGLSLYTYSITKAVTPLMIALLGITYWREIRRAGNRILIAAAIVIIFAVPQLIMLGGKTSDVRGRFAQLSIWSYSCRGCERPTLLRKFENMGAGLVSYFTPSFLFISGDRGDHWTLLHPPGFGQLLPEQAILIALALKPLVYRPRRSIPEAGGSRKKASAGWSPENHLPRNRRRIAIFLLAWLIIAAVPGMAIAPLGAYQPEPGRTVPTAFILMDHSLPNAPLTPGLLLQHPDSRHTMLQMAPWTLLSALGFVTLLELSWLSPITRNVGGALLLVGAIFHGARFVHSYFHDFPVMAAPYFQYGIEQVFGAVRSVSDPAQPVIITDLINQPYIYVLFFERYPPAEFQRLPRWESLRVSGPIVRFDRYLFVSPERAWTQLEHGTFVFSALEQVPAPGGREIRYPDGRLAYTVLVK